jgi:uncharacterized protein (DUF2147 family)
MIKDVFLAAALIVSGTVCAEAQTAAGLWKTFGDHAGEAESLVRIIERNGEFEGRVEVVFSPPSPIANPRCDLCPGELKDKPVVGLRILKGLRRDGDTYSGGEILDPDDGKVYKCDLRLTQGGRKLEVRGYIGIPLFGRTQRWLRQE